MIRRRSLSENRAVDLRPSATHVTSQGVSQHFSAIPLDLLCTKFKIIKVILLWGNQILQNVPQSCYCTTRILFLKEERTSAAELLSMAYDSLGIYA